MRLSGRITAAIEILEDFEARRVPLKTAIADWSRGNRYAGAKDRAWISGLCLDVLRRRNSLTLYMDSKGARAHVFCVLVWQWRVSQEELVEAAVEEHGPGSLSEAELKLLSQRNIVLVNDAYGPPDAPKTMPRVPDRYRNVADHVLGDYPDWMDSLMRRAHPFPTVLGMSLATRGDVDLRLNTLKTTPEKALAALKTVNAEAVPFLKTAARIAAPDPSQKAPAVTVIPAFNKGWVEVQDLGSQIAASAAGAVKGAQVLDYCAGGGGKTLALAAMMENTGQLYAYDRDARRLAPLFDRAKRAGVRNLQIRSPAGGEDLSGLEAKMDVVFVDAPCTGAGTWRRHPDTKWRLTEKQLQTRMEEQDAVLAEASRYVKPGGRLVWVTCSFLMEENEDRLAAFLETHAEFSRASAFDAMKKSGLLTDEGEAALAPCVTSDGAIRLTPDKIRADGFFVAVLTKAA